MMKKIVYCLLFVLTISSCQNKMTIVSYNIHNGRLADNKTPNIEEVSNVIKNVKADFICLQEVDSVNRRNNFDETYVIGKYTGLYSTYGAAIKIGDGKYGVSILSKKKPLSIKNIPLPGREEHRTFLLTEYRNYYVGCTHLSLNQEDRMKSANIILSTISKLNKPVFIGGDFNDRPTSDLSHYLDKNMECLSDTTQKTFPANHPKIMIDYIWAKGFKGTVTQKGTINEPHASDHRPIYVKIKW
ncbi:MAG: endonuclease/exonuclease/phosphatase family protein [Prevotella sp.]|nr:endonuclease/exonuclease/phosphatase family protein [Prevotella sp.]